MDFISIVLVVPLLIAAIMIYAAIYDSVVGSKNRRIIKGNKDELVKLINENQIKFNIPEHAERVLYIKGFDEDKVSSSVNSYTILWKSVIKSSLKAVESEIKSICDNFNMWFWLDSNEIVSFVFLNPEITHATKIPLKYISCFSRFGDFYASTKIEGGGGGGSSLSGALIGGAVAGGVGAVIGSRKEIDPITSKTIEVDRRNTILYIADEQKEKYLHFDSKSYEKFLRIFPQKEINFTKKNGIESDFTENITIRIRELKKLKDEGLITDNEYENKKKELLKKL